MSPLSSRRYVELVDRLNGLCGKVSKYMDLKLTKLNSEIKEEKRFILLKDDKNDPFGERVFMGVFSNENISEDLVKHYNTEHVKFERIYLKDIE